MKILFVHPGMQSFMQRDLDILSSTHEVVPVEFTARAGLARNLGYDLWNVWHGVRWCDLTFSWFGKLHAFFGVLFSKALGKKAVVVAGGDDVERGTIGGKPYGMSATAVGRRVGQFIFTNADLVLSVSRFNFQQAIVNVRADPQRTQIIYHGFDCRVFRRLPGVVGKEPCVLTVGRVTAENCYRKGHRLFVEAAHLLPDTPFVLVGPDVDGAVSELRRQASPNMVFTGEVSFDDLLAHMGRSSVYVQASEYESFGCSLAEAMLCECVPVVSARAALPEVVGDCGLYVDRLEPHALAQKIKEALQVAPTMAPRARLRIMDNFPLEKRRRELLATIALLDKS